MRQTRTQNHKRINKQKGQRNLAKGEIAGMQNKYCRYLLPYSAGGSTRRGVGPGGCIWHHHLGKGKL